MDLHLDDFLDGYKETCELAKQGENVFDMGNHTLFPQIGSQQKWKFAKKDKNIHLSDGTHVYSFETPEGLHEDQESPLVRTNGKNVTDYDADAESRGLAQVHRADPGSIYFTMQEGTKNPTYTFKHTGGSNWRSVPKKKKAKVAPVIPNLIETEVSQGLAKAADFNQFMGKAVTDVPNAIWNGVKSLHHHPLGAAAAGTGLGALYHFGKRTLYNTPAENEQETSRDLLKRMALPAVALGGLGAIGNSMIHPDQDIIDAGNGKTNTNVLGPSEISKALGRNG